MKNNRFIKVFLSSLLLTLSLISFTGNATVNVPNPTNYKYINDYTNLLNANDSEKIISIGKELEDKTSAQAVIVVINSTEGMPIENYAINLFRTWGIGQKAKDNGLLLLVALNDKTWRVEVGRGLEGAIPDALSNQIMESVAKPLFQKDNYVEGLLNSYSVLCDNIATEYNVTLDKSLNISLPTKYENQNNYGGGIALGILLLFIFIDIIFNRGRILTTILQLIFISNLGRRGPRGGPGGGGFGGFGGGASNGGGSSGRW